MVASSRPAPKGVLTRRALGSGRAKFLLASRARPRLRLGPRLSQNGEVAERFKAPVLKTVEGQPSVGSNPTLSAILLIVI